MPPMKITGKTVIAMTQETGAADASGRIKTTVTYDELSYEMGMNGQRSPRQDASPLAGKAFVATYSADGAIVDVTGPPGTEAMTQAIKQMLEQMSGRLSRLQLAVGETASVPFDVSLPVPIPGVTGTGITGESTVKLVSLGTEPGGTGRIASCDTVFHASLARVAAPVSDRGAGELGVDLKLAGTGASRIDVDRHVMRSNAETMSIDGTITIGVDPSAPRRMKVHGAVKMNTREAP